jgi:hypothetical protein
MWEKHFKNIRDFVPACRKLGYKGMIMTSWSTSGAYSPVWETDENITDLYAIRHVYPISGFNMLLAAYAESLLSDKPLDIDGFIASYCKKQFGFNAEQSAKFWEALKTAPYQIDQGGVVSTKPLTVEQVLDSTREAWKVLYLLTPSQNKQEFEHYLLMESIRVHYLGYEAIEKKVNSPEFTTDQVPGVLKDLQKLMGNGSQLNADFVELNKDYLYIGQMAEENMLRYTKVRLLYERLSRNR